MEIDGWWFAFDRMEARYKDSSKRVSIRINDDGQVDAFNLTTGWTKFFDQIYWAAEQDKLNKAAMEWLGNREVEKMLKC